MANVKAKMHQIQFWLALLIGRVYGALRYRSWIQGT